MNWQKFAHILTPEILRTNDQGNETTTLDLQKVGPLVIGQKERIPEWNPSINYAKGERVQFKFSVYEALEPSTGEQPIIDNQLNEDGGDAFWRELPFNTVNNIARKALFDQSFSSQKIYLEHVLNAVFNNNTADPYDNNDLGPGNGKPIYIQDNTFTFADFIFRKVEWPQGGKEIYLYPKWSSTISYSAGDYAVDDVPGGENVYISLLNNNLGNKPSTSLEWDYVEPVTYIYTKSEIQQGTAFTIFVPVEVKNTLTPLTSNWERLIKDWVDFYNLAFIDYTITTY